MSLEPWTETAYSVIVERRKIRLGLTLVIMGGAILGIFAGVKYLGSEKRRQAKSIENFSVAYPTPPKNWNPVNHGPQTLFLFEDTKRGLLMRGSVNQMVADINPTPDLDRDNLAKLMIDNTHANMPGWTAEMREMVQADGTSFRLIRRAQHGFVNLTACAVKGNTTFLVSLVARDKKVVEVDNSVPEFENYLSKIKFTKADSSRW